MRIRFYFNAWAERPLVWSYDLGGMETEVKVANIDARGLDVRTGCDPTVPPGDKTRPRVWFESDDMQGVTVDATGVAHVVGMRD